MTATRHDIEYWLEQGIEKGASHVVVVHDTYDHDNFPLYIMPGQNPRDVFHEKYIKNNAPPSAAYAADECYDLTLPIDAQLREQRAHHWEPHTAEEVAAVKQTWPS